MNCPRDNTELDQVTRDGTTIDVCSRCHGKWLDRGEFEQLVLTRTGATADSLRAAIAGAEGSGFFPPAASDTNTDAEIACLRCGLAMNKVRFEAAGAELTADRCKSCGGFWLDPGEAGSLFVFLDEQRPIRGRVWALVAAVLGLGMLAVYWQLAR